MDLSSAAAHQNHCQMWRVISCCENDGRHLTYLAALMEEVGHEDCDRPNWSWKKSCVCREFPTLELGSVTPR